VNLIELKLFVELEQGLDFKTVRLRIWIGCRNKIVGSDLDLKNINPFTSGVWGDARDDGKSRVNDAL